MESSSSRYAVSAPVIEVEKEGTDGYFPSVDPLLVEALQNPRHRISVLRMELDIQRFIQNPELQQFQFQYFPTSFLKCCAHRVAQHYGLQTMSSEMFNKSNIWRSTVIAIKTSDTKAPSVSLSQIPPVKPEQESTGQEIAGANKKIVILPRQGGGVGKNVYALERKEKSEIERKEDYEKARARIFETNGEEEEKGLVESTGDEKGATTGEVVTRDSSSSTVAIFKDDLKDRIDPDFDRRSVRGVTRYFPMGPPIGPQPPHVLPYGAISPYMVPNLQFAYGYNQMDCNFVQWVDPNMMYMQSSIYPQYQQPLRF